MNHADTTSTRTPIWLAFFAGALAWTLHELVSYFLVRLVCAAGLGIVLHLLTLCALALTAAGVWVAWRELRRDAAASSHFVASAAVVLNLIFGFAILMEGIPNVVVSPCL